MSLPRVVHQQTLVGWGTLRIAPVDPARDLDLIDAWVHEERARFWGMRDHSRQYVQEIYEYLDSLVTHHAYLVFRDEQAVALFQTYQPEADPIGECYEVQPGDLGVHLLLGPAHGHAEPGFSRTLIDALLSFVLADPTVQRIVAEPDVRNTKALARFARSGFRLGSDMELPDKRARFAYLTRKEFSRRSVHAG